jgi:hypothetical protein
MTFPAIFLAAFIGALIVASFVFLQRLVIRGSNITSVSLLARFSSAVLYMVFAAMATSLLSVLLSSPALFADGMFRMLTGAPLFWTFTSPHLILAFVVVVFVAAGIGFQLVHGRAARSRPFRRFLRGLPPSSGRVQSEDMKRYPPPPSTIDSDPPR